MTKKMMSRYDPPVASVRLVSSVAQQKAEARALAASKALDILDPKPTRDQLDRLRQAALDFLAWERLDDAPAIKGLRRGLLDFADAVIDGIDVDCLVLELSDWEGDALEAELAAQGWPPNYQYRVNADPAVLAAVARRLGHRLAGDAGAHFRQDRVEALVCATADIYQEITGRPAGYSEDRAEADPQLRFKGKFIELLTAVLAAVGENLSNQRIGEIVKEIRKSKRF